MNCLLVRKILAVVLLYFVPGYVHAQITNQNEDKYSESYAKKMDSQDPLAKYRDQFLLPKGKLYFTGNSLGAQPKGTRDLINHELDDWSAYGVEGHFHADKPDPWVSYHELVKSSLAKLVGAKETEVTAMNSLSVNLNLMVYSYFRPTQQRHKIIMLANAFPSDLYAIQKQLRNHGYDPEKDLILIGERDHVRPISTDEITTIIREHGNEVALVVFEGVQYSGGQFFDINKITEVGHEVGAIVGVDLAHAIGNVPLKLHDWNVDFAVWCSYKYLNAGPGAIAGVFVHEKHFESASNEKSFVGWWSNNLNTRFKMGAHLDPISGVDYYSNSNPPIFQLAALRASLELFEDVGIDELRKKSVQLTGYLEELLKNHTQLPVEIITPSNPDERGAQLSLVYKENAREIYEKLEKSGVLVDWREPNIIRVTPVPFYNSFEDVYNLVKELNNIEISSKVPATQKPGAIIATLLATNSDKNSYPYDFQKYAFVQRWNAEQPEYPITTFDDLNDRLRIRSNSNSLSKLEALEILADQRDLIYAYMNENIGIEYRGDMPDKDTSAWLSSKWQKIVKKIPGLLTQYQIFNHLHQSAGFKIVVGRSMMADVSNSKNPYREILTKEYSKSHINDLGREIRNTGVENLSNDHILSILSQQRDIFQKGFKAENYPLITMEKEWWNDAKTIEYTWKRIQKDVPGLLDFNVIDELTYEIASLTPGNNLERMAVFCDLNHYSKNQYQIVLDRTDNQDKKTISKHRNYYGRDRLSMNPFFPINDQPPEWWDEFRVEFPETWIGSHIFKKIETISQAAKAGHQKVVELWLADVATTIADIQKAIDVSIDHEQQNILNLLTNDFRVDQKMMLHVHERQELVRLEKAWKIEKEGGQRLSQYNLQRLFRFSARFGRDQNILELTTKLNKETNHPEVAVDSRLDSREIVSAFRLAAIHQFEKIVQFCLDTQKISLRDLGEIIHEVGLIDGDEGVMKVLLGAELIKNEKIRKLTLNQAVDEMVNTELKLQIFRHAHREEYGNLIHHDGDYLLMDALYVLLQDPVIDPELKNQGIDMAIANIHPSDYTRIYQFQNIRDTDRELVGKDDFQKIKEDILKSEERVPVFEYPRYNDFMEHTFNAESKIRALVLERDFYNSNNESQKYGYTKVKALTDLFNQRIDYLKSRLAINASWDRDLDAFETVVEKYGINDRTYIEVVAIAFNTKNNDLIQILSADKRWKSALQDMRLYAVNTHNNVVIENLKWFDEKQKKQNNKNRTIKNWFVDFYKKYTPIFGDVATLDHEISGSAKKNELSEFQWAIYDAIHAQINPETQLVGKAKKLVKKPLKELLQMPESADVIKLMGREFLEYAILFSETIDDPKILNIFHSVFENPNLLNEVKENPRFVTFALDHPIIVANGITGKDLVRSFRNLSNAIENNKILKFRKEFVKRAGLGDLVYIQKNKNSQKLDKITLINAFTLAVDKNKNLVVRELNNHKYIGSDIKEAMFLLAASYGDKRRETFEELKNEVAEPILEKALSEQRFVHGDVLSPTIRLEIESILKGESSEANDRFMGDSEHQPIYMTSEYSHDDVVVHANGISKADLKKWTNAAVNWLSNLLDYNPFGNGLSPIDVYLHDEIMSDIVRGRNDPNWNSQIISLLTTFESSAKNVMKISGVEFVERAIELNSFASFKTLLSLAALDIKNDKTLITKATLNALMTDPEFSEYDHRTQYLELLLAKTDMYSDKSLTLAYLLGDKEVFGLLLKHSKNVQLSDLQKYESMLQSELTAEIKKITAESGFVNNDQFLRLIEVFNHNKELEGHKQVATDFYAYLRANQTQKSVVHEDMGKFGAFGSGWNSLFEGFTNLFKYSPETLNKKYVEAAVNLDFDFLKKYRNDKRLDPVTFRKIFLLQDPASWHFLFKGNEQYELKMSENGQVYRVNGIESWDSERNDFIGVTYNYHYWDHLDDGSWGKIYDIIRGQAGINLAAVKRVLLSDYADYISEQFFEELTHFKGMDDTFINELYVKKNGYKCWALLDKDDRITNKTRNDVIPKKALYPKYRDPRYVSTNEDLIRRYLVVDARADNPGFVSESSSDVLDIAAVENVVPIVEKKRPEMDEQSKQLFVFNHVEAMMEDHVDSKKIQIELIKINLTEQDLTRLAFKTLSKNRPDVLELLTKQKNFNPNGGLSENVTLVSQTFDLQRFRSFRVLMQHPNIKQETKEKYALIVEGRKKFLKYAETRDESLLVKKALPPVETPTPDLVATVTSVEAMIPVEPVAEKKPSAVDDVVDLLNQAVPHEHYGPMDVINYVEEIKHDDAKRVVWNNLLDAMGIRTDITDLTDPAAKKFFEYALYVHKHGSLGSRSKLEGVVALRQIGAELFKDRIQDQGAYNWNFQAACDALIFGQAGLEISESSSIFKSKNYKSLIASTDLDEVKQLRGLISSNDLAEAYLNLSFEQQELSSENKKSIIDYLRTETYAALKNGRITDRYLVEALIGGDVDLQTISASRKKAEANNNKAAKNTLQRKTNFIFIEAVKSLDLAKIITVLPDVSPVKIDQALELLNKHPDLKNSTEKTEIVNNLKFISDARNGNLEDAVRGIIKNKFDLKIKDLAMNVALDGAVTTSPKQNDYIHIIHILAEYGSNEQIEIVLKKENLPVELKKLLQIKLDKRNQNGSSYVVNKSSIIPITADHIKPLVPEQVLKKLDQISKMGGEELGKLAKDIRMQIFKGLVTTQLTLDQSRQAIQYLAKASQIEHQAKEFPKEFGKFFSVLLVLELKKVASRDDVTMDDFLNLLSQGPLEVLKLATFSTTSASVVTGWGLAEQLVQTKLETQYRPMIVAEAKKVPVWGQALERETSLVGMGKMQVAMLAATLVNQMIYGPKLSGKELIANCMRSQAEFFLAQITVQQIALRGLYAGIKYSKTLSSAAEVAYTGAKTGSKLLRVTPVGWASFLAQMIIVDKLEEKYQKDTTLTQANNNMYESEYDLEAYLRGAVPSKACDGYADKGSCFANRAIQGLRNYDASALDYQFKEQQAVLAKKQESLDSIYNHSGLWNSQDEAVSKVSTGIKLEEYKQDQRKAVTDYIRSINPRLVEMQNTIPVAKKNAFYTLYTSSEKLNQVMDEHCSGLDDEKKLQALSENEIVIRIQKCDAEIKNYQMSIQEAVQTLSFATRETQRKYNMGVSSWVSEPMSRGEYVDQALYMIGRIRNLYATGHEELRDQVTNEMFHQLMETVLHPVVSKMHDASEGVYYASFHAPLAYGPGYYKSIKKTYGMYDEEGYKAHLEQQMEALKHPELTYKTDDFHDHTISIVAANPAEAQKKYKEIVSQMTKLFQCDQKSDVFTSYLQKYMGIKPESPLSSHLPNQDIGYVQIYQPVKIERLGSGLNQFLKTFTITRPQLYVQDVACSVH